MIFHFPFSLWEESRGFLGAEQEFWRAECRVLTQGELQVKCWQEAAPMPGSTPRDSCSLGKALLLH